MDHESRRENETTPAAGCGQFLMYLAIGAAILLALTAVLFVLFQVFSPDRWRGDAIAWVVGNVIVGAILLAIPAAILLMIIRRYE